MKWQVLPLQVPTDGTTVWVRTWITQNAPFQAVWDLTMQTFTDATNGLIVPWYAVYKWRDL